MLEVLVELVDRDAPQDSFAQAFSARREWVGNGTKVPVLCAMRAGRGFCEIGGEISVADNENLMWMYWCRGLTLERWRFECRLVEERLRSNLIRSTLL